MSNIKTIEELLVEGFLPFQRIEETLKEMNIINNNMIAIYCGDRVYWVRLEREGLRIYCCYSCDFES